MITFMKCEKCGNIITFLKSSGVIPTCCGESMSRILPGVLDGAKEKHVPLVKVMNNMSNGCTSSAVSVEVGDIAHPMIEDHFIQWIILETNDGYKIKYLNPYEKAEATFCLDDGEKAIAAYAYCNIHGLWRTEV